MIVNRRESHLPVSIAGAERFRFDLLQTALTVMDGPVGSSAATQVLKKDLAPLVVTPRGTGVLHATGPVSAVDRVPFRMGLPAWTVLRGIGEKAGFPEGNG